MPTPSSTSPAPNNLQVITLAGGCFWCLETLFNDLTGVTSAISGYTGGDQPNPTYQQVCDGQTGHAEAVQVTFDPTLLPCADLLTIFFTMHDPTTLNRQGADIGPQYRSAIFYSTPEQEATARQVIATLTAEGLWPNPIVTQVTPAATFYPAEDYHQQYYANNRFQPYCQFVITPKVAKFRQKFAVHLKK